LNVIRVPGVRTPPGSRALLVEMARRLAPADLCVQLVLADDACLRRLNRRYRGRNRSTDVLSFLYGRATNLPRPFRANGGKHRDATAATASSQEPCTGAAGPDAELYVSLARAAAQARERRHALRCELMLLALHGMLHLQGHDHERAIDARRMRAAETPHLRWLARRTGWSPLAPLVPGRAQEEA